MHTDETQRFANLFFFFLVVRSLVRSMCQYGHFKVFEVVSTRFVFCFFLYYIYFFYLITIINLRISMDLYLTLFRIIVALFMMSMNFSRLAHIIRPQIIIK